MLSRCLFPFHLPRRGPGWWSRGGHLKRSGVYLIWVHRSVFRTLYFSFLAPCEKAEAAAALKAEKLPLSSMLQCPVLAQKQKEWKVWFLFPHSYLKPISHWHFWYTVRTPAVPYQTLEAFPFSWLINSLEMLREEKREVKFVCWMFLPCHTSRSTGRSGASPALRAAGDSKPGFVILSVPYWRAGRGFVSFIGFEITQAAWAGDDMKINLLATVSASPTALWHLSHPRHLWHLQFVRATSCLHKAVWTRHLSKTR